MSAPNLNFKKCKDCQTLKSRIQDGMFDHQNKRWVDETGLLWSGLRCPSCHKEAVRKRASLRRAFQSVR